MVEVFTKLEGFDFDYWVSPSGKVMREMVGQCDYCDSQDLEEL